MGKVKLEGSVGDGGDNNWSDVFEVQSLLNKFIWAGALPRVSWPLVPCGICFESTVEAIEEFQISVLSWSKADGLIEPGGKTMDRLNGPVPSSGGSTPEVKKGVEPPSPPNPGPTAGFSFPLAKPPRTHWTKYGLYFGAPRGKRDPKTRKRGRERLHAGCDLLCPQGTKVYAIAAGKLVYTPKKFTSPPDYSATTYEICVVHGPILVRYGEVEYGSWGKLRINDPVAQGQVIGKVGGLEMLHFEVYNDPENPEYRRNEVAPFKRSGALTDPASYLELWSSNLPTPA